MDDVLILTAQQETYVKNGVRNGSMRRTDVNSVDAVSTHNNKARVDSSASGEIVGTCASASAAGAGSAASSMGALSKCLGDADGSS